MSRNIPRFQNEGRSASDLILLCVGLAIVAIFLLVPRPTLAQSSSSGYPLALGPSVSIRSGTPTFGAEVSGPLPIPLGADVTAGFFPGFIAVGGLVPTSGPASFYAETGVYFLLCAGIGGGVRFDKDAPLFWHVFVGAPVPIHFWDSHGSLPSMLYVTPYWRPQKVKDAPWAHEFGLSIKVAGQL